MGIFKKLFGRSTPPTQPSAAPPHQGSSERYTVEQGMRRVFELRKRQGWDGAFVQGETALILTLVQAGESPENIARVTLTEDWPSLVAKFAGSPDYLKVMGVG